MTANLKPKRIRDTVFIAHRYIGLAVGLLAAAIALAGSLLNLHVVWDKVALRVAPVGDRLPIEVIIAKTKEQYPNFILTSLSMPTSLTEPLHTSWKLGDTAWNIIINPSDRSGNGACYLARV